MSDTELIVILDGGAAIRAPMSGDAADDVMKQWAEDADAKVTLRFFDPEGKYHAVCRYQKVIGMYLVGENPSTIITPGERLAAAQEKIADAIVKQVDDGDEWKNE